MTCLILLFQVLIMAFNLGSDVLYSGTVSAAMESAFYGIPGLALSVERYSIERGHEMHPFIHELIEKNLCKW